MQTPAPQSFPLAFPNRRVKSNAVQRIGFMPFVQEKAGSASHASQSACFEGEELVTDANDAWGFELHARMFHFGFGVIADDICAVE